MSKKRFSGIKVGELFLHNGNVYARLADDNGRMNAVNLEKVSCEHLHGNAVAVPIVKFTNKKKRETFETIAKGELFTYRKEMYIKLYEDNGGANAVNLNNGTYGYFIDRIKATHIYNVEVKY